jgi:hypothetical protein
MLIARLTGWLARLGLKFEPIESCIMLNVTTANFLPVIAKNGKVSRMSEKVAEALNSLSARGIVGAAMTGKGAIGTQARKALASEAVTLDYLLSLPSLEGSQWGDFRGLLQAEFGVACMAAHMRGRKGCTEYMYAVVLARTLAFTVAETEKTAKAAQTALSRALDVQVIVDYFNVAADSLAQAAREADALAKAGLTLAGADAPADAPAETVAETA